MPTLLAMLIGSVVIGVWTFMWLIWMLEADIRAGLVALLFPRKWLGTTPRKQVAVMSPHNLDRWLVASFAPMFVCQLLTCHRCLSAHIAGCGTILLAFTGTVMWPMLPLIWACSAGIGNLLYDYHKRAAHKN